MHVRVICCALVCWAASGAEPSATQILQRSAAAYRNLRQSEFHATVQTVEGGKASQKEAEESAAPLRQIDQNVKLATIDRQEQYVVDGKAAPVFVVRVVRDPWPAGTLPGAQFAMYRIDRRTYLVHKVITYAPQVTEIVIYDLKPPRDLPQAATIIGMRAPDFTLKDTSGHAVSLRGLRGRVVLIDFWATWCGPCRALMPRLEELHREFAKQGLVVLGLDIGEDAATVSRFAKEKSYDFPLLLGAEPDVSAEYFVEAYPTTFLIDRQGRIAFRDLGGESKEELRAAVTKALGGSGL
jgi:thiol-disulfide isomerase/thioredoxin